MTQDQLRILTKKITKFLEDEIYNDDIIEDVEEKEIYEFFIEYMQDTINEF